ncbi:hypothetical protein NDU88_005143 [Pleurodeles waltl]|uniref:Uncharacterized protein n=1 Tax=Pleurodeles waltl TaxID=8319 RepID=A0AAV7MBZ4_PLEWA|nr:hypothetical protein NDU88_005143 [Pleurodeles waltl]
MPWGTSTDERGPWGTSGDVFVDPEALGPEQRIAETPVDVGFLKARENEKRSTPPLQQEQKKTNKPTATEGEENSALVRQPSHVPGNKAKVEIDAENDLWDLKKTKVFEVPEGIMDDDEWKGFKAHKLLLQRLELSILQKKICLLKLELAVKLET